MMLADASSTTPLPRRVQARVVQEQPRARRIKRAAVVVDVDLAVPNLVGYVHVP